MTRRPLLTLETFDERITPAAGQLDPTFGTGGIVTTTFGSGDDTSRTIAIDAQSRIVVGGYWMNGSISEFALARYLPNGTLDPSFDGDSKVTTSLGAQDDFITDLEIDSQGRIVAGGWTYHDGRSYFGVARYNSDGSLDNTFGTAGI